MFRLLPLHRVLLLSFALSSPVLAQWPPTSLHSAPLSSEGEALTLGPASDLASEPGYDNQPFFLADGSAILFTSERAGDQTEIFRLDLTSNEVRRLTDTPEAEYSPTPLPSGGFSTVRVEADGTQRLWRFDDDGANPRLLVPTLAPVGYHAWSDRDHPERFVAFVLGEPNTLQRVDGFDRPAQVVAKEIGRALHAVPGRAAWSFVAPLEGHAAPWVQWLPFDGGAVEPFAPVYAEPGDHDLTWTNQGALLMTDGVRIAAWSPASSSWRVLRDFAAEGIEGITRMAVSPSGDRLVFVAREKDERTARQRFDAGRAAFAEAQAAKGRGEATLARHALERAAKQLPPQAGLQRRRAGAAARDGRAEEAFGRLEVLVGWGSKVDLGADVDLEALRGPRLAALAQRLEAAAAPLQRATVAFKAGAGDFVSEGVTHDAASGAFFVGSLRKGLIVRRGANGTESVFADLRRRGYGSVVGMAVDTGRRRLWAAVSELPPADNFVPDDPAEGSTPRARKTGLCSFDLESGAFVACFEPPANWKGARFDDVVVASDGTVFVSDAAPAIRLLEPGGKALTTWLDETSIASPNGLALSIAEDALYVADYAMGLLRVDRKTREVRALATPGLPPLIGIDGLARWRKSLIAIQNGVAPPRVLRVDLAEDGLSVDDVATLERACLDWDEPTLGVVAGGDYYYVSNSHWPRFGEDGSLKPGPPLTAPTVMKLGAADLGRD
jgi:hypothetical protein